MGGCSDVENDCGMVAKEFPPQVSSKNGVYKFKYLSKMNKKMEHSPVLLLMSSSAQNLDVSTQMLKPDPTPNATKISLIISKF